MFFFNHRREHLVERGRTIGVHGDDQEAAIAMAQRIWDGLADEEPALGYSLLETRTGRICYVEVRRPAPRPGAAPDGAEPCERPQESHPCRLSNTRGSF
jgi:hypothetical protein